MVLIINEQNDDEIHVMSPVEVKGLSLCLLK